METPIVKTSFVIFLVLAIALLAFCRSNNANEKNSSKAVADQYAKGLVVLQSDSSDIKSQLGFLKYIQSGTYNSSGILYNTLQVEGEYAALPTKWEITFRDGKAAIINFNYSTNDTTDKNLLYLRSWVAGYKDALVTKYGEPSKTSDSTITKQDIFSETSVWRLHGSTDSLNEEVIILSLSSDRLEHPPFTKHYDIQFKHFYLADAPTWYRTLLN